MTICKKCKYMGKGKRCEHPDLSREKQSGNFVDGVYMETVYPECSEINYDGMCGYYERKPVVTKPKEESKDYDMCSSQVSVCCATATYDYGRVMRIPKGDLI